MKLNRDNPVDNFIDTTMKIGSTLFALSMLTILVKSYE